MVFVLALSQAAIAADDYQAVKRKKVEAGKKQLEGTEWTISILPFAGKDKPQFDVLGFDRGKVGSRNLLEKGFSRTKYTITPGEGDDFSVWETMQTNVNPSEGIVFIRGEWKGDDMSGTISHQRPGGVLDEYYFSTSSKVLADKALAEPDPAKTPSQAK